MSGNSNDTHELGGSIGTRSFEGLATLGTHPSIVRSVGRFCRSASNTKDHKEEARANFGEAFRELAKHGLNTALIELLDYDKNTKQGDTRTPGFLFQAAQAEPDYSWGVELRKSRTDFAYYSNHFKAQISELCDMLSDRSEYWQALPEHMKRELVVLLFPEFTKALDLKVGDKLYYSLTATHDNVGHNQTITGTLSQVSINLLESETKTGNPDVSLKPVITLFVEGENGIIQEISIDNDKKISNIKVADLEHTLP